MSSKSCAMTSLALEFIAVDKTEGKHKPLNPDFCARENY
jgi:hypothetical protein